MKARTRASKRAARAVAPGVAVATPAATAPGGLAAFDRATIATTLAVKAVILLFGALAYSIVSDKGVAGPLAALELWNRWDAPHYLSIARDGYQATGEDRFFIVFYPLYPLATRLAAVLVQNPLVAAFLVSGVASLAVALLLWRLARLDGPAEYASRAVWFLLIFPTAYFLHIGYTESLFIALVLGSFLAARRDRWALVGALGALACLTRINGLVLIPALAVEVLLHYRATRRFRAEWCWIALPLLGVGAYLLLNQTVYGDPLQFLTYQREHWYKTFAWPWQGIAGNVRSIGWRTPNEAQMIGVQEVFFIVLGLVGTIAAGFALRPSYAVWMAGNWLLFTSTSFILSVPRYSLILFPLYLLFARLAAHRTWHTILTVWSLLFMSLFIILFVQGRWAF